MKNFVCTLCALITPVFFSGCESMIDLMPPSITSRTILEPPDENYSGGGGGSSSTSYSTWIFSRDKFEVEVVNEIIKCTVKYDSTNNGPPTLSKVGFSKIPLGLLDVNFYQKDIFILDNVITVRINCHYVSFGPIKESGRLYFKIDLNKRLIIYN